MQEYKKCVRGGACVAVSLERLCRRKCKDMMIKKRDGGAQLWISRSRLSAADSELQSFFCLCDAGSSTPSSASALDSCTSITHGAFTTDAAGSPGTDLLNLTDNANHVTQNINCAPNKQTVILYNDNILKTLFSDAFDGCVGITGRCLNNNFEDVFQSMELDWSDAPNNNDQHEQSQRDVIDEGQTDGYICDEGRTEEMSAGVRRKSVSFADDVIVYLYDKDSPTEESHPESSSSLISEILFDDNGLEWDDDFLALEEKCRPHSRPRRRTSALRSLDWTVKRPKRFALPQSVLFLTHVNDSDLEL